MIVYLIAGLIKKIWCNSIDCNCIKMSRYYPKPYKPFDINFKVKVDVSNYATKTDIKNISHVETSSFGLKINLANLKTEVNKSGIDKLVPLPTDLSKLSNVLKRLIMIN